MFYKSLECVKCKQEKKETLQMDHIYPSEEYIVDSGIFDLWPPLE